MTPEAVIQNVIQSGLRGRGGAAFPTGQKWLLARQAAADVKYVVCNADEGEPGAYMDRTVLESDPHAILEGMLIGSFAVGASEGFIYIRNEYPLAIEIVEEAIDQAEKHGLLGDHIFGTNWSFRVTVRRGAGAYICGEETALIESLEGHAGEPRTRPPYPVTQGLWGKPTVVNNVKTWASVPPILTRGAEWYAAIGTKRTPGTTIFSLEGAVKNAGLVEVPFGITLRELVYDIGGGLMGDRPLKALQAGGASRGCIPPSMLDLAIDTEDREGQTIMIGTGGIIVLDESACMVDMTRFLVGFFLEESCGKCVPCREGLKQMSHLLGRIARGEAAAADLALLERLVKTVKSAAVCGMGGMAPDAVLTTLTHFRDEFIATPSRPAMSGRRMPHGKGLMMDATASELVLVNVDGRTAEVARDTTILNAARQMGVAIPTLCNYRGLTPYGACRVCLVEIETPRGGQLVASCSHPVESNLVVHTETDRVKEARQTVLELLLAQAPDSRELAELAAGLGVRATPFQPAAAGKCVLCGLCTRVCSEMMGRGAINFFGRGTSREIRTAFQQPTDQCQACGSCVFVCPTGAIDLGTITARRLKPHATAFDQYLTARPCIDLAHPQASPRVPAIDRENCIHFKTGQCGLCQKVCQAGAIDYEQTEETVRLEVGSVVLTPGFEAFDATRRGEFGFSFAPNVVSNVQFERMLSAAGPTQGHIRRPSDGKPPQRLAFIQCVGSRDTGCDNDYCSSVCCMAATKEAILAKEHEPGLEVTIFFLDLRAFGKDFDRYCDRAKNQLGVRFIRSFISRTYEMPGTRNLRVVYADGGPAVGAAVAPPHPDERGGGTTATPTRREFAASPLSQVEDEFDMIVLSLGLEPSATLREQAGRMGVLLNRWGFAQTSELCPLDTSRPGVFVGGAFQEPKDIPDTVMQASAAAARAMALLAPARGTRVRTKTYPPQRDIADEPPRVGVFICHCGSNIASVVDVQRVVKRTRELPFVAVAESNTYTCADDTQNHIKDQITRHGLNRVVVASCTPRTHEPIFRDTLRDAGLNPYLLEMANIRDQCSWVHSGEPGRATDKAIDLVRMAVARAARLMPLSEATVPVNNAALVVGGGIAGITAALALADQGFPVHLVEKTGELGGMARQLHNTLDGEDIAAFLGRTLRRLNGHPRISVHLNAKVAKVEGHVGAFSSLLRKAAEEVAIKHGVVVVATGAAELKPQSFGYGQTPKVLTQLELTERLKEGTVQLSEKATVVMIQCVEQRNTERPYCSRVCCTAAVHNALGLRQRFPRARIMVLYRDMRTYGFREAAYREAREKGVLFVRYEPEQPPQIVVQPSRPEAQAGGPPHNGRLQVRVREPSLGRDLQIEPELVVLAAPMVPGADRGELSELLRVPLNADGFFLEAHMKLRPVDFASEGLFLCGTAHAPKFTTEAISQANAVAGRAASILARKQMSVSGQIAFVDPDKCISCMTCVHVCPYLAPQINMFNKAEVQGSVCMGCGSCTAECPAKAIALRHYVDAQVLAAVNGLLDEGFVEPALLPLYPEQVGVAPPRWRIT